MPNDIKISLITAISLITGVVISQTITLLISFFDKRHKKHQLLRQKYEEMMFYFQDSLAYFQEVQNCKTRHQLFQLSMSPQTGKACGLALLYFPNLVTPLNNYALAQVAFFNSVITSFDENIPANAGGQAMSHQGHKQIMNKLFETKNSVMDALIKNANKYTKA